MHSPPVQENMTVDSLFPELAEIIQDNSSIQSKTSLCIGGCGDEVLTLHKNQLITLPPYTLFRLLEYLIYRIILLSGQAAKCEGEVSIIVTIY